MPSIYRALVILLLAVPAFCASEIIGPPSPVIPKPRIALTFDDGPHPDYSGQILAVLEKEQVPATFFVVGSQVEKHPDLIFDIFSAGHDIEVHTYTHRNLCTLTDNEITRELIDTQRLIECITGDKPYYYRPPGGQHDERVEEVAGQCGLKMVLWTVFTNDHSEDDPSVIIQRIKQGAADEGIVLIHSGRPATLAALPGIIRELKGRGFEFVTIKELKDTDAKVYEH